MNVEWTQEEKETLKLIYKYRQEAHDLLAKLYLRHSYLGVIEQARYLGIQMQRPVMKLSAPLFDGAGRRMNVLKVAAE
jgi:hypothetical protein